MNRTARSVNVKAAARELTPVAIDTLEKAMTDQKGTLGRKDRCGHCDSRSRLGQARADRKRQREHLRSNDGRRAEYLARRHGCNQGSRGRSARGCKLNSSPITQRPAALTKAQVPRCRENRALVPGFVHSNAEAKRIADGVNDRVFPVPIDKLARSCRLWLPRPGS